MNTRNIISVKNKSISADPYWFLEATVHREGKNIFNLAYRLCQDKEEAREIAQTAFLKTLENYRSFESKFHIYIFLCRTAFNIWKKKAGRRKKYPKQPHHISGPDVSKMLAQEWTGSRTETEKKEQRDAIRKGMAGLPTSDAFIIVLRDIEGKSYLEIASILKCNYNTIKLRLARARKRLYENILPDWEKQK